MRYCKKHCVLFVKKCEKCVAGNGSYLRCREEVMDPKEWEKFKKLGWVR